MLTINTFTNLNSISRSGAAFKSQKQKTNQQNSIAQNVGQFDTFTKTNTDINFTRLFNKKPLPKIGAPNTPEENKLLLNALTRKGGIVWNWMEEQSKYSEYFDRLEIDAPKIALIQQVSDPTEYKDGNISSYNWATNTINLNLSYLPNMALINNGNVALVSRDIATSFIRKTPGKVPNEYNFEDLNNRSIGFALQSSEETGRSYFYKLSPEETAELATQYIAQEIDRLIAFHVLLNTETIGGENELISKYYNHLKNSNKLQPNTTGFWVDTYPGEYKEMDNVIATYPTYKINGSDKWEITPDGNLPYIKPLNHKELYSEFVSTDNSDDHPYSRLELGSLIASKNFMEQHILKGNNERERERLEILHQVQLGMLNADIEERIKSIKG